MQTLTSPDISELIAQSKKTVQDGEARMLRIFEFVPEDKLNWSPSSDARTSVQIVAHCALANDAFARTIRGEKIELPTDPAEIAKFIRNAGREINSREVAVGMLKDTSAQVLSALDNVRPEQLETSPISPVGPLPFAWWMRFAGDHMDGHSNQLSYIQTIWGDFDDHVLGPGEVRS